MAAWSTFTTHMQELLTRHKKLVADFLDKDYDKVRDFIAETFLMIQFFTEYTKLLTSSNYVTKRQSLKVCLLLGWIF